MTESPSGGDCQHKHLCYVGAAYSGQNHGYELMGKNKQHCKQKVTLRQNLKGQFFVQKWRKNVT